MRISRITLCAITALALAGCGPKTPEAASSTEAASAAPAAEVSPSAVPAASVADAAVPAKGAPPTKAFMVGKWAEGGDCQMAIGFKADGTMDGPFDRWELNGAVLTMVGNPQKMTLSVIDNNTMESRLGGTDAPRTLKRC